MYNPPKCKSMLHCLKSSNGSTLLLRPAQMHCRPHKPNYYLVATCLLHPSLDNLQIPDYYSSSMHIIMNHACCCPCFLCLQSYKPWPCGPKVKTWLTDICSRKLLFNPWTLHELRRLNNGSSCWFHQPPLSSVTECIIVGFLPLSFLGNCKHLKVKDKSIHQYFIQLYTATHLPGWEWVERKREKSKDKDNKTV